MEVSIVSVAAIGPGFNSWAELQPLLTGAGSPNPSPTVIPKATNLPPAERRRVGQPVRLALNVAADAIEASGLDPVQLPTVFACSSGDGENCHVLCENLALADRSLSPTKFTNSVHNAPAGYWGIATGSMAPSVSLCSFDFSFGAGLLEAVTQSVTDREAVTLIAYDVPYPEPLHTIRPIAHPMGVALVLAPTGHADAIATLNLRSSADDTIADTMQSAYFESLRRRIPVARALPLLQQLATGSAGTVCIESSESHRLLLEVSP